MGCYFVEADAGHIVQRRAEADGLDDCRSARLEAVGRVVVGDAFGGDLIDHLAAALVRRHALEMLGLAEEHADAGWAIGLVAGTKL